MPHLVTIRPHPTDPEVLCLSTPPDMATVMGGFGPARYVGNAPPIPGTSYAISTDDLPRFRVYCTNRSVQLVDARQPANTYTQPLGRGAPLPECRHCAQPARRGARLQHCPNCGAPWDPIELGAPYSQHLTDTVQCGACQRHTPVGYSHCTQCGAPIA